jgi:hypothetical protein
MTMVFELMRNQIQLEFAVCNSHTRKMKSISGWKDENSVVKKIIWFICQKKSLISFVDIGSENIFDKKNFSIIWTQNCII